MLVAPVSAVVLVAVLQSGAAARGLLVEEADDGDLLGARQAFAWSAIGSADGSSEVVVGGERRLSAEEVADPDGEASSALEAVLGERFGGTWVDQDTGRRQVAMVRAEGEQLEDVSSLLGLSDLDTVEVARSVQELEALKAEVQKLGDRAGINYMVGINVGDNVVDGVIEVESWSDDRIDELRDLIGRAEGALVMKLGKITSLYSDTNVGDVRMYLQFSGGDELCTTGFAIGNGFGEFMTSAGHCSWGQTGISVYNSSGDGCCKSTLAGSVTLSHNSVDVLAFWRASDPKVWNGSVYPWVRNGVNPQLGESVCYRGATSVVQQCGTVSRVNYSVSYQDFLGLGPRYNYAAFCVTGVVPQPGDSGSGIYRYRSETLDGVPTVDAKGLLAIGLDVVGGTPTHTCGPTIGQVLSATNSQLLVK